MTLAHTSYSDWKHPTATVAEQSPSSDGWSLLRQEMVPHNVPMAEAGQGPPSWFYALTFGFNEGEGGYTGMQVDQNGRRVIFSIWNATGASSPTPGAVARPFSGEGNGYQVLVPYTWVADHVYEFEVRTISHVGAGTAPWQWTSTVVDKTTGVSTVIGTITVPYTWRKLNHHPANFVEWYPWNEERASCNAFPYSSVSFRAPYLDQIAEYWAPIYNSPSAGPGRCVEEKPDQYSGPCFSRVVAETSGGLASKLHTNGYDVPNAPAAVPVLQDATINGDTLSLRYSMALDPTHIPDNEGIAISVNGAREVATLGVSIVSDVVTASFPAVAPGDNVTASYYRNYLHTVARIQTAAGGYADQFVARAVTNLTTADPTSPPPLVQAAPPGSNIELEVRSPSGALRTRVRLGKARSWQDARNDLGTGSVVLSLTDVDSQQVSDGDIIICVLNGVFAASTTLGSTTLTSTGAGFTDADIGREIRMDSVPVGTMILNRLGASETERSQNVRLSAPAGLTLSDARMAIVGRTDAFAWIVEDDDELTIQTDEEAGQTRTVSGRGRGSVLEYAVVHPAALARGDSRIFDYTSSDYFSGIDVEDIYTPLPGHGTGSPPPQVIWSTDSRNRVGYANGFSDSPTDTPWLQDQYPEGWPNAAGTDFSVAQWLWPFQLGSNPGEGYFRRVMSVPASDSGRWRLFYTADDFVEIFLDGEQVASISDPQMFYTAYTVDLDMDPGTHLLAVHVRNTGGPGGFVGEIWRVDNDGQLGNRWTNTNANTWLVGGMAGVGSPTPGMTAGHIMEILMGEARGRGALTGTRYVPMGFSRERDSYGAYWGQLINPAFAIGATYVQVLAMFADLGIDWWVEPRTGMLRLSAEARGVGRSAAFRKGVNIDTLQHRRNSETLINSLLGRVGLDNFAKSGWVTQSDDTSIDTYGRREASVSASTQPLVQWSRLAGVLLDENSTPAETATLTSQVRHDLTGASRVVPFVDYAVGDWVLIPGSSKSPGTKTFRVRSISVSEDEDGHLQVTPELGSAQAELTERVMRWLNTMVPGTLAGQSSSGAIPAVIGRIRL